MPLTAAWLQPATITVSDPGLLSAVTAVIAPRAVSPSGAASRWRRRFRRYCHWLERQATNFSGNTGVFTPGPNAPVLSAGEITRLAAVATDLIGLGYVPGTPTTAAPITAP